MRKIKDLRENEVLRLAAMHDSNYTEDDYRTAKRLMNSFYRLCGLCESNLYRSNDEFLCNSRYTQELENREIAWHERLTKQFYEFAGLSLVYCGYCPSIGIKEEYGGFDEKIHRYFYK